MRTPRSRISELRLVIDCMPLHTRTAMLEGVRSNPIIAGAYTDRDGGVCPMLAAHRCGGRTDYPSFARAWDRFTGVARRRARRASARELRILETQLEASLLAEENIDLGQAIADYRRTSARRVTAVAVPRAARPRSDTARPGDPDRAAQLRDRAGWAWLRPFRRLDDYNRALDRLQADAELHEAADRAAALQIR